MCYILHDNTATCQRCESCELIVSLHPYPVEEEPIAYTTQGDPIYPREINRKELNNIPETDEWSDLFG